MIAATQTASDMLWQITEQLEIHICIVAQLLGVSERTAESWLRGKTEPEQHNRRFISLMHMAALNGGQCLGHTIILSFWGAFAPFADSWLLITKAAAQEGA